MKKILLLLLTLVALSSTAGAQNDPKNVLSVSPFRLWNGLRIKYERVATDHITWGGVFTGYYGSFPGVQAAPFLRFYCFGSAPEGLYLQGKAVGGFFRHEYTKEYKDHSKPNEEVKYNFSSFGGGVAAGYQVLFGKDKRWSLDMNLGVKIVGGVDTPIAAPEDVFITLMNNGIWYTTGPGSYIDGLFSIGYRF